MNQARILIAGIGNVFLGDDAFGVEVVQGLFRRSLPDGVRAEDFGIRGYDLACALVAGYETVVLVDATTRGKAAGTLYVMEPELAEQPAGNLDPHSLDPVSVLQFAKSLGGPLPRVLFVGCEPAPIDEQDMQVGLSPSVQAAVDEAVKLVESLVQMLLTNSMEDTSGELMVNHPPITNEVQK